MSGWSRAYLSQWTYLDYDLDYTTGWDGDFNEHTYIPPDTLVADMRHGERPDGGGGRDND